MYKIQLVSIIGSLVLLLTVLGLIKNNKLKIRYAVIWLFTCLTMLIFSVWRQSIDVIAGMMNIYYPPSVLFLAAFLFLLIIVLHFSIVISQFAENQRRLAQEVAMLEERLGGVEKKKS